MKELGNLTAALALMLTAGSASAEMLYPAEKSGKVVKSIDTTAVVTTVPGAADIAGPGSGRYDATAHARIARLSGLGSNAALELFTRRAAVDEPGTIVLFGITAAWMAAHRRRKTVR